MKDIYRGKRNVNWFIT